MKKSILALVVSCMGFGMGSAYAATIHADGDSSLELGGRVEGIAQLDENGSFDGDLSRVRLNLAGETQVGDDMKAIMFFEQEWKVGGETETRDAYVGLIKGNHTIVYGREDSAMGIITDFTDVMLYHGASAGQKWGAMDKTDSNVVYTWAGENLILKANVSMDETDDGGSVAATYQVADGVKVGASAGHTDATEQYMVSASFTTGDMYFGSIATAKTGDVEYIGYEVVGRYNLDKLTMGLSYEGGNYDGTFFDADNKERKDISNLTADVGYNYTDNIITYASVVVAMNDESDTLGVVGLKYEF
jgi:outer membrane protein OmpU